MKDIAKKTKKELVSLLSEKRLAMRNFRFSVAGSNTKNVKEGKSLRRDVARILTKMNSKASE